MYSNFLWNGTFNISLAEQVVPTVPKLMSGDCG